MNLSGACKNGDNCSFAHDPAELRNAPKNRQNEQQPGGDSEILAQQLGFIANRLYELYPANENVHYYLKNASELLRAYNIELAADTLHKILNNPELVALNKAQHDSIVEEAKNYGKYVESNWQHVKTNANTGQNPAPDVTTPPTNAFSDLLSSNNNFGDKHNS